ncbi:MAG: DUF1653 domain-containing protein [Legionellaceae bacterium]|nr:DUF1653 domain-containing protein [Legionellaceae bacterium]MBP9776103.1 DUF1653 domain-containing protein [Legionellaceae bacterium]
MSILYSRLWCGFLCEKFGNYQIWVRPKQMFFENVTDNGESVPRFQRVG